MTSKASIDDKLVSLVWFGKLEEEDSRGKIIDICKTQVGQGDRKLMGDDLS